MKFGPLAVLTSLIVLGLRAHLLLSLHAGVPEQFQVWGTAGPRFPPAPADWREEAPEPEGPAVDVQVESRDQLFGEDDVARTRAHCDRLLRAERGVFGAWRFPLTFEVGHQITHE